MNQDTLKKLELNLIYKMFSNKQLNLVETPTNNYAFCFNIDCNECLCRGECDNLRIQLKGLCTGERISKAQVEELLDKYSRGHVSKVHFEELLDLYPEMRIVL